MLNALTRSNHATHYRSASGLVLRPKAEVADFSLDVWNVLETVIQQMVTVGVGKSMTIASNKTASEPCQEPAHTGTGAVETKSG